jgi:NAD(P)-dependent dehydrogenase (short-subunit alcohol dehydrogenase family)
MPTILVVGATRGLGASIVNTYAADANNRVLATARTSSPPANSTPYLLLHIQLAVGHYVAVLTPA